MFDLEEIKGLLLVSDNSVHHDDRENILGFIRNVHNVENDGREIGKQGTDAVAQQTVGAALGGGLAFWPIRRPKIQEGESPVSRYLYTTIP